jgi:hypothetical protein
MFVHIWPMAKWMNDLCCWICQRWFIYFISRANLIGVRANVPILYSYFIGGSMRNMPLGKWMLFLFYIDSMESIKNSVFLPYAINFVPSSSSLVPLPVSSKNLAGDPRRMNEDDANDLLQCHKRTSLSPILPIIIQYFHSSSIHPALTHLPFIPSSKSNSRIHISIPFTWVLRGNLTTQWKMKLDKRWSICFYIEVLMYVDSETSNAFFFIFFH